MKTRIITAAVCVPLLVAILLSNSFVVMAALMVLSLVGLTEFYKAVGLTKCRPLCIAGYAAGLLIPMTSHIPLHFSMLLFYLLMLVIFGIMLYRHKTVSVTDAALVVLSLVYIPYFLTHILYIREMEYGKFYIWFVFIGAFLTDSCAYFSGVFLGKHKLCPEISPKKTIEGAVGGVIGCIVFFVIYGLILEYIFGKRVSYPNIILLGAFASVISEIGDLAASIIKRHYGIKDYGNLFPGHGGVLDRCDSVILVSPAVFMFLLSFEIIL